MFFKIFIILLILNFLLNTNAKLGKNDGEVQYEMRNITANRQQQYPRDCVEATAVKRQNGIYIIQNENVGSQPFPVLCDGVTNGGGWLTIQQRLNGDIDFYRNWTDYKIGFGYLEGDFWLGLNKIHAFTTSALHELLIVMHDHNNITRSAHYETFAIGSEDESFVLKVLGKYAGDAGDSLTYHAGRKFSTRDRKNDENEYVDCAVKYTGGWWYRSYDCYKSNLNGQYWLLQSPKGICWDTFHMQQSLQNVTMMIRPHIN